MGVSIPRSIPKYREPIIDVTLHGFGDASGKGVSAAVYAVISQKSGVSVGLVTAKARLAKRGLNIPQLELVSANMVVNLTVNVGKALISSGGVALLVRQHCCPPLDSWSWS